MIHIINHQLLGDSLMVTPALKALEQKGIEYTIYFQDTPIMEIFKNVSWIKRKQFGTNPTLNQGDIVIKTDAGRAMRYAITHQCHYSYGFAQQLGINITHHIPDVDFPNWPDHQSLNTTAWMMRTLFSMRHSNTDLPKKPTLLIFPDSTSCAGKSGQLANKMLPWHTWEKFYQRNKEKYNIAFLVPDNSQQQQTTVPLSHGFTITEVAHLLTHADKVLCVDNGIGHLSNAVGANAYMIGGCVPIPSIWAGPMEKTINCFGSPHLVSAEMIELLICHPEPVEG